MECITRAHNAAAMAVVTMRRPSWTRTNKNMTLVNGQWLRIVSCSALKSERSLVKEGFADEEDYIKGGGSELLFVEMQQNKDMNRQPKLADKFSRISTDNTILDMVVIGCGPAGLALAAESAKLGLNVGLIGPDLPSKNV